MKALSVLVLRYKQPANRDWKVPLNYPHRQDPKCRLGLFRDHHVTLFSAG